MPTYCTTVCCTLHLRPNLFYFRSSTADGQRTCYATQTLFSVKSSVQYRCVGYMGRWHDWLRPRNVSAVMSLCRRSCCETEVMRQIGCGHHHQQQPKLLRPDQITMNELVHDVTVMQWRIYYWGGGVGAFLHFSLSPAKFFSKFSFRLSFHRVTCYIIFCQ